MTDKVIYSDSEGYEPEPNDTITKIFEDIHNQLKYPTTDWENLRESLTILIDKPELPIEAKTALLNIVAITRMGKQISELDAKFSKMESRIYRKLGIRLPR